MYFLIRVDLSITFDTMDHDNLLSMLIKRYVGIGRSVLRIIPTYFSRTQSVQIDGIMSDYAISF